MLKPSSCAAFSGTREVSHRYSKLHHPCSTASLKWLQTAVNIAEVISETNQMTESLLLSLHDLKEMWPYFSGFPSQVNKYNWANGRSFSLQQSPATPMAKNNQMILFSLLCNSKEISNTREGNTVVISLVTQKEKCMLFLQMEQGKYIDCISGGKE